MTTKNNHYQLYLEKVIQLAQTLIVKSEDTAKALNKSVAMYYGTEAVGSDPKEWKYYRHLAGEYHPTDVQMYVTSMDTLEKILFSKENLKIHRATARAYALGTRYYKELAAQYPEQEILLRGILNPTDMDTAINARDGLILNYQDELVEENEYTLIIKLQRWSDNFKARWVNTHYSLSDDLYLSTMLGIYYLHMVPAILNFRLEACGTNEAHSFHVGQYLASHGVLDSYQEHLTKKQALWLYRNIRYIDRNAGSSDTFAWLIENVMTVRDVPLAMYTLRHDVENMTRLNAPTRALALTDEGEEPIDPLLSLEPVIAFRRKELNLGYSQNSQDTIDLDVALLKEDKLARANEEERDFIKPGMLRSMVNSRSAVVQTKLLESAMVDYSDSAPYSLDDVLLSHWIHTAAKGYYTSYVNIANPLTGERIPLNAKDAYVFMWYCMCKAIGIDMEEIPPFFATRVLRDPVPSADDLMSVVDRTLVDKSVAELMLNSVPDVYPVISTEAFYGQCVKVYESEVYQRSLAAREEHKDARAMVQNMAARLYSDSIYHLEPEGTNYGSWLSEKNISVAGWDTSQFMLAYTETMREATGLSLSNNKSVEAMQRAMVSLLTQLSSYSIQVAKSINSGKIRTSDNPAIRLGDIDTWQRYGHQANTLSVRILSALGKTSHSDTWDIGMTLSESGIDFSGRGDIKYVIPPLFTSEGSSVKQLLQLDIAPIYHSLAKEPEHNNENMMPIPGMKEYLELPYYERHLFKDVYGGEWGVAGTSPRKLGTIIYKPLLLGLVFRRTNTELPHISALISNQYLNGYESSNTSIM